ncbi:MAG: Hsp20 family protein, partial [Candidatus Micrarchaeaceae archaeon]
AELKGVRKEDISISAKAEEITISVNTDASIYSRNIALPALIDPSKGRAKYNNGVLQIRLKKKSTKASYTIKVN